MRFSPSSSGWMHWISIPAFSLSVFLTPARGRAESAPWQSFQRAQSAERLALEHRQELEVQEWIATQKSSQTEAEKLWSQKKQAVFASTQGGAERRKKIDALNTEFREWTRQNQMELDRLRAEHRTLRQALAERQKQEAREFQLFLNKNENISNKNIYKKIIVYYYTCKLRYLCNSVYNQPGG